MKPTCFVLFLIFSFSITFAQNNPSDAELKGPYLGLKTPGTSPEIFAPGIISTDTSEGCIGWGNDMEYFVFQRWINRQAKLYIMTNENGIWSEPKHLSNFDSYKIGDYTIAPDGKTIVFASNIFIEDIGHEGTGGNIWISTKTADSWTTPKHVGLEINSKYHDSYPCLAGNNTMYFFSRKPGGFGKSDLYVSTFVDGKYTEPANLGSTLNTEYHEWDTYVDPDETYMIFCSTKPTGLGDDDLYVTFRLENKGWSKPIHMGNEINTSKSENRPYVSPDGKYLFYTSTVTGNRDIYWISIKILDELKANNPE